MNAMKGLPCVFVDNDGKQRRAMIINVHEPEIGTRARVDPATQQETEEQEEFDLVGVRVDLAYSHADGVDVDLDNARYKYSALHRTQQTPDERGRLRNYWEEAPDQ